MKKPDKRSPRKPSAAFNLLFLIFGIACFAYWLLNGILVRFGQSLLWLWPLIGAACVARFFLYRRRAPRMPGWLRAAMRTCVALALTLFLAVECLILSGCFAEAPEGLDYIVVLGAKVNGTEPSGALRNRIQLASEYLKANPAALAVASGGQGEDEGISEAQCILDGLTARGIDPARVLVEDQSTSTAENLRNSFAMIGDGAAAVGILTNNFHVYRALRMARDLRPEGVYGVPVATSLLSFPHYMLREFCSVAINTLLGIM